MHDLPGSAAGSGFQEDALGGRTPLLTCLQVNAEGGGVRIGCGIGTGIDVRDLKRAMASFVAGHLARAERGVGGHHVQAGIVCSTVGGQIENCDMVAGGFRETGAVIDPPRRLGFIRAIRQRVSR